MLITLVHVTSDDDGSPLHLTLLLDADRPPSVGDLITFGVLSPLALQVVERDWSQDLSAVTLFLRDPDVSGPLSRQQRNEALTGAGWLPSVGAAD